MLVELLCSPFPIKHSMNIKNQDNSKIFTQVLFFEYYMFKKATFIKFICCALRNELRENFVSK